MDCREIEQLLPDYLQHALDVSSARLVEEHLRDCAACGQEVDLWNSLSSIPDAQPSPNLRRNFDLMLAAYQQGRAQTRYHYSPAIARTGMEWMRHALIPAAAMVAMLIIGVLAGMYVERRGANAEDIAGLRQELSNTRQLVALSMLQQQSASDRLQGVSWTRRVEGNPEIVSALLQTLRYDGSVDVRLAALDALRRYTGQSGVRTDIEESFRHQKSPLVQIALVDLMVEMRDRAAAERLRKFERLPDLDPAVRERLEWGVRQLNRG